MSDSLEEMPLFLLDTVVFPYAQILVHVFEQRYLDMVEDCMRDDRPFGVVLIRSGSEVGDPEAEPFMVGTAVRILGREEDDEGRLNLRVQGQRRFRIRRVDESRPVLVGLVEPVTEMEVDDSLRTDALVARAREEFEAWMHMQIAHRGLSVQVRFPDDVTALSFAIANFLPISNREKQYLLEMTESTERMAALIPMLETAIAEMRPAPGLQKLQSSDFSEWLSKN
jgi:uncharacterized protein